MKRNLKLHYTAIKENYGISAKKKYKTLYKIKDLKIFLNLKFY